MYGAGSLVLRSDPLLSPTVSFKCCAQNERYICGLLWRKLMIDLQNNKYVFRDPGLFISSKDCFQISIAMYKPIFVGTVI